MLVTTAQNVELASTGSPVVTWAAALVAVCLAFACYAWGKSYLKPADSEYVAICATCFGFAGYALILFAAGPCEAVNDC